MADLLKPQGYATGQFGKNHWATATSILPTVHGFDEFFGNLYHLNAEEEPENLDYPKDPEFRQGSARAACYVHATDATMRPRTALRPSRQAEDRGHRPADQQADGDGGRGNPRRPPTTSSTRNARPNKPFFCWFNTTRMHIFTHLKQASQGKTGLGV